MQTDLATFLANHTPHSSETVSWSDGTMPLELMSYLTDELPPLVYVTSIRSLVFRGNTILVMRNVDGTHVWPGGRREAGETIEQTLQREVREEAGWQIDGSTMLGLLHYHHLNPAPTGYRWPHPDFVQLVFASEATQPAPEHRLSDDFEQEANWQPLSELQTSLLSAGERVFLDAALTLCNPHLKREPRTEH